VDFLSGTTQLAGKQIPGIPQHQLQLNAIRRFRRGYAVAEWQSKSQVWANDANTVAAKRFEVLNLRVGRDVPIERMAIAPMAAVNNLFDRRYAGSVAINATANKFFEPSPGRTFLVGARLMLAR
jgi:iron complex outermembrane receptor protein